MKHQLPVCALLLVTLAAAAQVASHAPTGGASAATSRTAPELSKPQASDKTVAKVNGTVLTERDLVREMVAIFPYARVHNGFPKSQEPEIRRGALDMIIFEELVYQEAVRRAVTVSPDQVAHGEREFRNQFHSQAEFQEYLKSEARGSNQVLRFRVKRALMIQAVLKSEVDAKSVMTATQLRAYYDAHRADYVHGETYSIQTISILPPRNANPEQLAEARKRADEAYRLAKATKSYQEFGMLAEKISDDDFHVDMGDHKVPLEAAKMPAEVVAILKNMQAGQISSLISMGTNYSIVRLVAHAPAGVTSFEDIKKQLREDQQKVRYNQLRAEFAKKLKKNARVEIL